MPTPQWASPTYVDDDFTVATPVGIPVFSSPIPANTDEDIFTQEFEQFRADFTPTPLNTPHASAGLVPDYSAFLLVSEGHKQDVKGGIVRWARTYAKVPDSFDEYESYGYPFIGFAGVYLAGQIGSVSPVAVTGRPRIVHVVTSRVQHDYFLVGSPSALTAPSDIPTFRAQRYFAGGVVANAYDTEYIMDLTGGFAASSPSRTDYNGWMANAAANKFGGGAITSWSGTWSSSGVYAVGDTVIDTTLFTCKLAVGPTATHPGSDATHWNAVTNPSQLLAEDSRLSRWMGNIWLRQSRFVLAI